MPKMSIIAFYSFFNYQYMKLWLKQLNEVLDVRQAYITLLFPLGGKDVAQWKDRCPVDTSLRSSIKLSRVGRQLSSQNSHISSHTSYILQRVPRSGTCSENTSTLNWLCETCKREEYRESWSSGTFGLVFRRCSAATPAKVNKIFRFFFFRSPSRRISG
jgi:hypothetical protein